MTNEEVIEVLRKGLWNHDILINHALNLAIEAVEKQIPTKPVIIEKTSIISAIEGYTQKEVNKFSCPYCEEELHSDSIRYCPNCGQALNWW